MKNNKAQKLDIGTLGDGIPALTPGKVLALQEACQWCLHTSCHKEGVEILAKYRGETNSLSILWGEKESDLQLLKRAYNKDDAIEYGAEALSLLLVRTCTDYTAIRRSATGTGIDYWLGDKKKNNNNIFSTTDARLEISGILKENPRNTVKTRIKQKLKQTIPSDGSLFPVLVSIIEFGHPKSEMVRKDV